MIPIIKNNFKRLSKKLNHVFLILLLTAASLFAALYIGNQSPVLGRIAVVSTSVPKLEGFTFTKVNTAPKISTVMIGKYDGWIEINDADNYKVTLPKNTELATELEETLNHPKKVTIFKQAQPNILKKVIGFVMMFLLMGGMTYGILCGEDKERKQLKRILGTPLSSTKYMFSHCLFNFGMLYIPSIIIFIVIQKIVGTNIGSSLTVYNALIALICFFSVSFSLFLITMFKSSDSANMIGSATIVLTTVLSGSFISLTDNHPVLEKIVSILPQHAILEICEKISAPKESNIIGLLLYVLLFSILCLLIASLKLKRPAID